MASIGRKGGDCDGTGEKAGQVSLLAFEELGKKGGRGRWRIRRRVPSAPTGRGSCMLFWLLPPSPLSTLLPPPCPLSPRSKPPPRVISRPPRSRPTRPLP